MQTLELQLATDLQIRKPIFHPSPFHLQQNWMKMATVGKTEQSSQQHLFDIFYEELLTQLMESGELQEKLPVDFMELQTGRVTR